MVPMKKIVNVHEAKTHLSSLLARVRRGDRIIIAKNGVPIAEIRPLVATLAERHFGEARGQVEVSPDFNAPLPEEVLHELES